MKRLALGAWLGFANLAFAQQSGATPAGDVFNVNTPGGGAQTPSAALGNLYQLAAQMTADPSPGYDRRTSRWPRADQIQQQWVASISVYGNKLTQDQRRQMVPCAANLNAAIDFMERGYRIEISQRGNMPAQLTARNLYMQGRAKFALCAGNDTFANNSGAQPGDTPPSNQPGGNGGQNGGTNRGAPPLQGRIGRPGGGNSGNTPGNFPQNPTVDPTSPGLDPGSGTAEPLACGQPPEWVQQYRAEGAVPSLRYQVGFNQGVAMCLHDQCTIQNLAIAVSAAAFQRVRTLLSLASTANAINAALHPPGFSQSPDPYTRGHEEGSRLCNWMLQLAIPVNSRRLSLARPGGKIFIPPGFSFYQAVKTIPEWLPKINETGCTNNCAIATVNSVRVLFGQALEAAPATTRGWTDGQMEAAMGKQFEPRGSAQDMNQALDKAPEGTVGVISAEFDPTNPTPGHFFWFVKANNTLQYWDGQQGYQTMDGKWNIFRWMVVGNPLTGE